MTATAFPTDVAGALARLGGIERLEAFRHQAAAALCPILGAPAVVLGCIDPTEPSRRVDVVATRHGTREVPAPGGTGLVGRALAAGKAISLDAADDPAILHECQSLAGFSPRRVVCWPLAAGPDGPQAGLLALDPTARQLTALGEGVTAILGAYLAAFLRQEATVVARRRYEVLLGRSNEVIGNHESLAYFREHIGEFLEPPLPVLLLGERGTGKRHLARTLHGSTVLKSRPFHELDGDRFGEDVLHALFFDGIGGQPALLTSEVFLFVPEAADFPISLQERLAQTYLPYFQEEAQPTLEGMAYIYFGTAADVMPLLQAGRASAEFFQLFGSRSLILPPLRQRPDDVPLLAEHFLLESAGAIGAELEGFTHRAIEALKGCVWAENLLGLREVIGRAVGFARTGRIDLEHIEPFLPDETGSGLPQPAHFVSMVDEATVLRLLQSSRHKDWTTGVRHLDKTFYPSAVPILFERLGSPEPVVRIEATRLLASRGDAEARDRLVKFLAQEDNRDVIQVALENLGEEARQTMLIYLRDDAPAVRKTAATALARIGGPEAVAALAGLTEDAEPSVRCQALAVLCHLGQSQYQRQLLDLLRDEDPAARVAAAEALGQVGGNLDALLPSIQNDPAIDVRIAAVSAVGHQQDPRAAQILIGLLEDPFLKFYAIESLGRLGASQAVDALLAVLERETNSLVRRAAIHALIEIGDGRFLEPILPLIEEATLAPTVVEALCTLGGPVAEETLVRLVNPEHPLCLEAVKGLGKIGSERSVVPLVGLLGTVPDFLARYVAGALAGIGPAALEPLIASLEDEGKRYWAIVALGDIGAPAAVGPLMRHWEYSDQVRQAIERIGPEAIEPLLEILPESSDRIADLFVGFGELAIEPALMVLDRPDCGPFVERVLVHFGQAAVGPLLAAVPGIAERDVLARVLRVLGLLRATESYAILLKHLAGRDPVLKRAVVEGLSDVDNEMILDGLLEAAEGGETGLRLMALRSLWRLRVEGAAERILRLQGDGDPLVRCAALLASTAHGDDIVGQAIRTALADTDDLVVRTAVAAATGSGSMTVRDIADRIESPGADAVERSRWVRALAQCPGEEAAGRLVEVLTGPAPEEVRAIAQWALGGRDSRILGHLYNLLESADAGSQTLGREIVDSLPLTRVGWSDLVRQYQLASPFRRGWIEYHLGQHGDDARRLLERELAGEARPAARFTMLYLLQVLASG